MELDHVYMAIIIVIIAMGVTLRSYIPFWQKKKEGKVQSFDWKFIATAVWAFFTAVVMNLVTAWALFKDFDMNQIENFLLFAALAFVYGFGGNDFWNRIVMPFIKARTQTFHR